MVAVRVDLREAAEAEPAVFEHAGEEVVGQQTARAPSRRRPTAARERR